MLERLILSVCTQTKKSPLSWALHEMSVKKKKSEKFSWEKRTCWVVRACACVCTQCGVGWPRKPLGRWPSSPDPREGLKFPSLKEKAIALRRVYPEVRRSRGQLSLGRGPDPLVAEWVMRRALACILRGETTGGFSAHQEQLADFSLFLSLPPCLSFSFLSSLFQLSLPLWGLPMRLRGKESACQCRFDPWVWKIPWRRKWQPTRVFLLGKSHGQRSLAGYSLWGHQESDMTEHACRMPLLSPKHTVGS